MNNTILSASGFHGQDSTCTSDHSLTRQNSVQEKRNTPPDEREDKDDKHVHIHSEETKSFDGTECAANVSCSIKEDEIDLTDQEAKILELLGPPPDGGLAAWGVVTGSFVVLFVQIGFIMSIGQLLQYYGQHQLSQYPQSTISWLGSICPICVYGLAMVSGRYFDAHGPRALVMAGTLTCTVALFGLAFCKEFWQFFLAHLLFGIGSGTTYAPCTAVVGHWFHKRRPTAIGVILSGIGISGVIFPIFFNHVLPQLGFRNTMLIFAGWATVMFVPGWILVKSRLPPKQNVPLTWNYVITPFKDSNYAVLVAGVALLWLNYFTPFFYANQWATHNDLCPHLSSYTVAFLNTGSFFGRLMSGPVAERYGPLATFAASGVASGVTVLALWTTASVGTPGTIVGAILYGFFSGSVMSLATACCAQISPVREFGIRVGMLWTCAALPLFAGPQICGVIISKENGAFTGATIFSGVTIIAGSALSFGTVMVNKIGSWRKSRQQTGEGDVFDDDHRPPSRSCSCKEAVGGDTNRVPGQRSAVANNIMLHIKRLAL